MSYWQIAESIHYYIPEGINLVLFIYVSVTYKPHSYLQLPTLTPQKIKKHRHCYVNTYKFAVVWILLSNL